MYMCNFRRKIKAVKVANNGIKHDSSLFISLCFVTNVKLEFLNV